MLPKANLLWLCAVVFTVLIVVTSAQRPDREWDDGGDSRDHDDHHGRGRDHHRGKHDDDDDDHKERHHKSMLVLGIVSISLAIVVIVLAACLCVLKKKARRAAQVHSFTTMPVATGCPEKKKLPEGDISKGYPVGYSPYFIKTVAPPAYTTQPGGNTPTAPAYPPSYSTLSLKRAAQE